MTTITGSSSRLGPPLGTSREWRRRFLRHHLPLAVVSTALFLLFMSLASTSDAPPLDMMSDSVLPQEGAPMDHGGGQDSGGDMGDGRSFISRSTTATGYVATGLLAFTLLIGPANLLLRRRNPVSTSLARDTGTWAVVASAVHVVLGFQLHGAGQGADILRYFVADGVPLTDSFGMGNWAGLAALVIAAGLLAISNDNALRDLKAKRWKNLQRLNYALFALVVLHAFFYGALLQVTSTFALVLIVTAVVVLAGQAVGIRLWRRRHRRAGDAPEQQPAGMAR